ncbi:MAG: excinuclease ABC subunit UvrC [candidate division WS1 bacterium]|jgi:excinuclease ABC subunit C|nr:excinuclease ABC subunit UvrC [candidate division WS1 bacterium]
MNEQIARKLKTVPDEPGAYMMLDGKREVIYVGKARSLRKRLQQWFRDDDKHSPWATKMVKTAEDFDYIVTNSDLEAMTLEYNLIKERDPRFNIRLVDDKSYPYLRLTAERYPRLIVVRDLPSDSQVKMPGRYKQQRGLHDPKQHEVLSLREGRLFGPFPSSNAMRRTMRVVQQLFGLRSCRRALSGAAEGRPCLNYHIDRCVGPCTGEVTPEEYAAICDEVALFLSGRSDDVLDRLREEMREAAERLDFERAAQLRDRLQAVETVTEGQLMVATEEREQDALGVAVENGRAIVAILSVRRGRLLEKEQHTVESVGDREAAEVLEEFLGRHYAEAHVPREVLLGHDIEDAEGWAEVLSQIRGQKVRVTAPQRGEKRRLVELAVHNATLALRGDAGSPEERRARTALAQLAEVLELDEPPERMECYDISTTQGRESTGSMVVFADGMPLKSAYRRFRMRATEGKPDDFAMMGEMLQRRLRRAAEGDEKFLPLPDLLVVDGGKGQLGVAVRALEAWEIEDVPVASLAKREEEVFVPGEPEPLQMSAYPEARALLQRMRDEAHRFAITHHRGVREKRLTESVLEQAPGIGPARRNMLLTTFGSIDALGEASLEEIAAVPGMTENAAKAVVALLAEYAEPAIEAEE